MLLTQLICPFMPDVPHWPTSKSCYAEGSVKNI